jgi:anti-sigma factor RsiW
MNCEQVQELLEAYALEALDDSERAQVEQHLKTCLDCQQIASDYASMTALLPQALAIASNAQPPAALKSHLLSALEAPAPAVPILPMDDPRADANSGHALAAQNASKRRSMRRRLWPVAAAFLMLILGTSLTAVLAREHALRIELANLTGQQELVLEIVDSPKMNKVLLRPPVKDSSTAYGKLYTRPDMSSAVAMAARLVPPPAGQSYHLWLTSEGKTQLAGLLTVNNEGFAMLTFDSGRQGPAYEAVKVTLQPVGSTVPVDPPILIWQAAR